MHIVQGCARYGDTKEVSPICMARDDIVGVCHPLMDVCLWRLIVRRGKVISRPVEPTNISLFNHV
jgi:hypothetical protein